LDHKSLIYKHAVRRLKLANQLSARPEIKFTS
jgi:sRNA-binding regulator protein Hfq